MSGAATTRGHEQRRSRSFEEWITFGIATLLLLGVVGLIIYDWMTVPTSPPQLEVQQIGAAEQVGQQYRVEFRVTNSGGETVAAVQVIGELRRDGEVVANGEQQIDFLAPGESEKGAFLFKQDPASAELELRVASYTLP